MTTPDVVFVDAHVHLHEGLALETFLDAAWENGRRAAGVADRLPAEVVLLLAQMTGNDRFEHLTARAGQDRADLPVPDSWTVSGTAEAESLVASRADGARIVLVCGRQIRSAEGLEALALATCRSFEDGMPIVDTLAAAAAAGGLPVLPWGVGKWLGHRGQTVRRLLHAARGHFVCGDNANRPVFWPTPRLLRLARRLGVRVLPGSDPLPLPGARTSSGRFGFTIKGALSSDRPAADLLGRLADPGQAIAVRGRRESPWGFLRNQTQLRVRARQPF